MSSSETTACEQAHSRLIDAIVSAYWSLPARDRGEFVVIIVNKYIHEIATRRPDLPAKVRDELTLKFGGALVKQIDYPNGDPRLRRLLAECEPAGRA